MKRKTALITGASQRIGANIAHYLHTKNIDVIVHYNRSKQAAEELVTALNANRANSALALAANLLDDYDYSSLREAALQLNGKINILINNASAFYPTPVAEVDETQWEELIGTNLKAPLFLCQSLQAQLQKTQGCIVNITDIHGLTPLKDHPVYSIAKAGLIMLTQTLAKELAPSVRVNAVSPGAILWPANMQEDQRSEIIDTIPLQRPGKPVDIAKAVYFLIAEANYMTGQVLNVDGGRSLNR